MNEVNPESFIKFFEELPDPRRDFGNIKHKLIDIIIIAISGVLAGADGWEEIAYFGECKEEWFKKILDLPNGIPSHDTFARVFRIIDPAALKECFINWIKSISEIEDGEIVSIDGKSVRHSYDNYEGKSAIHVVSAWAKTCSLVLAQVKVDDKSNEITAIPELLDLIDINGSTVTIDAMGCQKEIAKKIISKKADYLLALKGNQGTLHSDVQLFLEDCLKNNFKDVSYDYYETFDNDHGRIEKRKYWITDDIKWLNQLGEWKSLKSIGVVEASREIGDKKTSERRYYITSKSKNAKEFEKAVRGHWAIENSLHWVLDIAFNEDSCRKRKDHSAENFSMLRHIALNLLKNEKTIKMGVKSKRKVVGWEPDYLIKLFTAGIKNPHE